MKHHCHWPGCPTAVPPKLWGCKKHWYSLPIQLRNRIWATYKPGQEISKTPSREYVEAARAVREWILVNHPPAPEVKVASQITFLAALDETNKRHGGALKKLAEFDKEGD